VPGARPSRAPPIPFDRVPGRAEANLYSPAGVREHTRTGNLTQPPQPEIYLSLWQASAFSKDLVIRVTADPRSLMAAIQRELRAVDPTVAVENMKTLEEVRADSVASQTFAMQLLVGFALAASVLTLVGIYGVLSLSVASRRREIAVRAAVSGPSDGIFKTWFLQTAFD
jgi:putative ABC transport system permease protein